jgi:hypothetical protein
MVAIYIVVGIENCNVEEKFPGCVRAPLDNY